VIASIPLCYILMALFMTYAFILTLLTLKTRDLLKATIFSAGQAVAYTLLLVLLAAPDLVLAYVAVGVGMYTALFLFIISRTERFEKEVVEGGEK